MDFNNITDITTNMDDGLMDTTNSSVYIVPKILVTCIFPAGVLFGIVGCILCYCLQFRTCCKRESFTIMTKPIQSDLPPKYSEERYFSPENPQIVYNTFTYVKNFD